MDVASEKEKSKIKKNGTFLVEATEQSMVPFTKKESVDDWGSSL